MSEGEVEKARSTSPGEHQSKHHILPTSYNQDGKVKTKWINEEGESGRSGFHPIHFLKIAWWSGNPVSSWVNVLWPFVIAALVLHFGFPELHIPIFAVSYIAMVPAANMLGFAGQELARKLPRVAGILIETTLGSVVEIVLFMVLVVKAVHDCSYISVLQAAIVGSIMTNLLLCLGCCFLVGGIKHKEQRFHPVISETGSGILLVAGFALLIPSAFFSALRSAVTQPAATAAAIAAAEGSAGGEEGFTLQMLHENTLKISWGTSVILIFAFLVFLIYSIFSHDNIFDEVLKADEEADRDRHRDMAKPKFTLTECVIAISISLTFISMIAVFLILEIHYLVENGVPDTFLGFILVPLVEKLAEHITAVDEAYDNQINFALYHCIGPSIQTALFNGPLAVIVGWGLGAQIDLNFEIFLIVLLVLSILVVGNFLRDGASNWLEGALLVIVYIIIAITTYYYPNPETTSTNFTCPAKTA